MSSWQEMHTTSRLGKSSRFARQKYDQFCFSIMNAALSELGHLLRVLDERDIPLGQDDVAWAFDHQETNSEIASWVQEYIYPPTLLTKEELH